MPLIPFARQIFKHYLAVRVTVLSRRFSLRDVALRLGIAVRASVDLLFTVLYRPLESAKILRLLPRFVGGVVKGRSWPVSPTQIVESSRRRELNPLRDFFESHREGPGIWKWRHYFDIYHLHFRSFLGSEVHVAEVGVFSGGSLRMWREYFGRQSRIYGVDIEESCRVYEDEAIRIFIGDQADRDFWRTFRLAVPVLDILIDDGGHLPRQQIITLEEMFPHLRPGGVYLCEDVGGINSEFAAYVSGLAIRLNKYSGKPRNPEDAVGTNSIQAWVESIQFYPHVIVLKKRDEQLKQLTAPRQGSEWQPFL